MKWITEQSMRFYLLIIAFLFIMIVLGFLQIRHMPIDALPEFAPPYIDIQTEAPGLSSSEVEELVSFNLEELLNGTPWLTSIRSTSVPGLSAIRLTFEAGTDILHARQLVNERLSLAYALPNVAMAPVILQPESAMSRVMIIALSSKEISPMDLSVLTNWNIRQALLSIPGVANVSIWGLRNKQLQVLTNPKKLEANKITLDKIISTTGNALWVSPLSFLNASTPGSGGWIDTPEQRIEVRHVLPIHLARDLAQVDIESSQLRLGDVTKVVNGFPPLIGDGIVNNDPGLLIAVDKFPKANTLEVTRNVEEKFAELAPGLSGIHINTSVFRPAMYIESIVTNIMIATLMGFALLILSLAVFTRSWRGTLISLCIVVVSYAITILLLNLHNETMNLMVFGGLLMAAAIIIDEANMQVKYLFFELEQQQHNSSAKKISIAEVIVLSSVKIRKPMTYATLILLLILLPIFFFGGMGHAFFQPLALSYIIAVIAAFFASILFFPALCLLFFRHDSIKKNKNDLAHYKLSYYQRMLHWLNGLSSMSVIAVAILMSIITLALLIFLIVFKQPPLLPALKESEIVVTWEGPPGTSLEEMVRISTLASRELKIIPGVANVVINIGRAALGDKLVNVNSGEILINLHPKANYQETMANIKHVINAYPGIYHVVLTYLQNRTRQVLTGTTSDLVVRIFGHEFTELHAQAIEMKQKIAKIAGTLNVHIDQQIEQPEITIEVNLTKAQQYGLKPGDVRRVAATLVAGLEVGSLYDEQKIFPVVVWGTPDTRHSIDSIRHLLIDTPSGKWVQLEEVANVAIAPSPNIITHHTVSRSIDIDIDVKGRSIPAVFNDINQLVQKNKFPLEYRAKVLGVYQEQQRVLNQTVIISIAVAVITILLLHAALDSFLLALIIFFTLPIATLGSVLVGWMIDCRSVLALFGLLVVYGLTVRHVLLLITGDKKLSANALNGKAIMPITIEPVACIFSTIGMITLVLLPFILFINRPGLEIIGTMALIIIGGLITSLIYSLFIAQTIYCICRRLK